MCQKINFNPKIRIPRLKAGRPASVTRYKPTKDEVIGKESWVQIPGFGGRYEANYCGEVRKASGQGRNTITPIHRKGVPIVRLTMNGKRKEYFVSHLIAKTYLPPPSQRGMCLWHRNGIKTDNAPGNLVWTSKAQLGRLTGGDSKRRPVVKMDKTGEVIRFYPSARSAAKDNHMSYQTIIDRCNGKVKSKLAPDGYIYEWDEEA